MKRLLVGLAVAFVAISLILAVGIRDRTDSRGSAVEGKPLVSIGRCDPETDLSAAGWDYDPTAGNWGGKDESEFAVAWEPDAPDKPALVGRLATCTIEGVHVGKGSKAKGSKGSKGGPRPKKLEILSLEGLANDDYCVWVSTGCGDLLVGCKDPAPGTEDWVLHEFDFSDRYKCFGKGQDTTITIQVTGNAWDGKDTWGQLGVDYIELFGN